MLVWYVWTIFFFFFNCDLWPFSDTAIYSKIMKSCVHCAALEYHLEARVVTVHPSERESIPDLYRKSLFSVEKNVQTYMVKVLVLAGSFWIIVIQKMQRMNQCELTHCSPFFSYHTWLCSNGSSDTWYIPLTRKTCWFAAGYHSVARCMWSTMHLDLRLNCNRILVFLIIMCLLVCWHHIDVTIIWRSTHKFQ